MPQINLSERLYYSDKHEHLELFYSRELRPCGGRKGQKSQKTEKKPDSVISNGACTVGFSTPASSEECGEALIRKKRSQEESLARTRRDMLRFVNSRLYGHHIRFVTLTYATAPESEAQARKHLYACMDRFSTCVGHRVQWLAVPEHGSENGRFHWHVLFASAYIRNEVFQKEFWKRGFVKITKIRTKKGHTKTDSALSYMMKYISKDLQAGTSWKHRWFHSRGTKVVSVSTSHRIAPCEFSEFLTHLDAIGFKCVKKDSWTDGEFGACSRYHFVRPLTARNNERNVLSYFSKMKNLYSDINYYGFAASEENIFRIKGECEDLPTWRSFIYDDTAKMIFYDRRFSLSVWKRAVDFYYRRLWQLYKPYRLECERRGEYLPDVFEWFVSTGKIESFGEFLLKYSYFYVPITMTIKEV